MSASPEVVLPILASKLHHEPALLNALSRIDATVFAINPDFKSNDGASFARHGVHLRVIQGVGHYTMMEAPEAFNEMLAAIVDGLPMSVD